MTVQAISPKILIAEDELIVAENIARNLRQQGYEVIGIVDSGEAAIEAAVQNQPDLVLMDIMLQGKMDGIQATAAINTQCLMPVIYMTAYADDETLERAKLTEPYGYLVKPFKPHDLKTSIEIALQKYSADQALKISYEAQLQDVAARLGYLTTLLDRDGKSDYSDVLAADELVLASDLVMALERREFYLVYQPRVDLISGCITGAEALVRWQHPTRGLISPAQFISIAEMTGRISAIGEWVLRTACKQLQGWQQQGLRDLTIAVNVSGYQLKQLHLYHQIHQILQQTGLSPQSVELELTESTLIEDIELASQQLQRLKEMGLRLAMDDFGTGYSCLSHLHRLPFDTLKLDRSFVRNIDQNPKNGAIATAIIAMCQQLALRVVAEGVETQEELAFLRQQACDEMQGFLFSRALSATEFASLVERDQRLRLAC